MAAEVTNRDRSDWANVAVSAFARKVGMNRYDRQLGMIRAGECDSTILGDLLADLRHWCNREAIDFDVVCERSNRVYQEELEEDAEL